MMNDAEWYATCILWISGWWGRDKSKIRDIDNLACFSTTTYVTYTHKEKTSIASDPGHAEFAALACGVVILEDRHSCFSSPETRNTMTF